MHNFIYFFTIYIYNCFEMKQKNEGGFLWQINMYIYLKKGMHQCVNY